MDTNTKSPIQDPSKPSLEIRTQQPHSSSDPTTPSAASAAPAAVDSKDNTPTTTVIVRSRPPQPPSSADADVIYIPTYSRWFSWNGIHDCEVRFLPEFFDGRSPSKNPRVYKYYRNSIISRYRENPTVKISFTEARKTIIGDVGSVRRVFDFLEAWGLINYFGSTSKTPLKWEDKESKSTTATASAIASEPAGSPADFMVPKKRLCSGCKSVCSIACFVSDKYDLTLCARCYVRGNYRVGVSCSDFKRVEINDEVKADWTDKETLHLLEAIMHYGDNWKKVAEHVGGRSERECVVRFIKLPFGEQFIVPPDSAEVENKFHEEKDQTHSDNGLQRFGSSPPAKKMRLTPLADASNPIMAQAAFLSALVGINVAEATARAAIGALSEVDHKANKEVHRSLAAHVKEKDGDFISNGSGNIKTSSEAHLDVQSQLEREERDLERAISRIVEVQMKEIQDKILHFEDYDLQMEREWQQLQQMRNLLFVDQLTLLFNKTAAAKTAESVGETAETD